MKNQIIIHAAGKQTRIALIENGELAQFFIESPENQRTVGDVYLAEVHKVMSGIRAAFIDMGTPKDAFLHFSDVGDNLEDYIKMLNGPNAIPSVPVNKNGHKEDGKYEKLTPGLEKQLHAGEILAPNQRLLVQIVKEPIGSKGPRVSTDITLAGRFLVLVPLGDYIGVSKRIRSYKERRRLRNIVSANLPESFGVIVRTVADGQKEEVIKRDLLDLLRKWEDILSKIKVATPPALLYRDLDMTESLIRDLFAKDYNRLLVDDPKMYRTIKSYVANVAPHMLPHIELFRGSEHIFDYMKISQDVESIFSPRVKMPSGGYLIFEQTEAMYVIDVNSGRYAAKKHQEDNSLRTNLEAAREIAKQLRLRDIGGIIVVDFIDLRDETNRKKVYDELKKEFKKDRAKTNILPMSDFGLVQITRQRIRPSVVNSVSRICPMCGGSGSVVSQNTIVSDVEAWLSKFRYTTHHRSVDLYINPYLKSFLTRGILSQQIRWMFRYRLKISMISDETVSLNDYKFTLAGSDVDITEAVLADQSIEEAIKHAQELIAQEESQKEGSDKSNLDVYDAPKRTKFDRVTVATPATKPHSGHIHEHEKESHAESKSKTRGAKEYYKEPQGKKLAADKKTKISEDQTTETDKRGQSKRSGKISKYYKSKADSDSKEEESKSASSKPKQENNTGTDQTSSGDGENQEKPRSALEVAREYRLQQLKAEKTEESAEPADSGKPSQDILAGKTTENETDISKKVEPEKENVDQKTAPTDSAAVDETDKKAPNNKQKPAENVEQEDLANEEAKHSLNEKTKSQSKSKATVRKTTTKARAVKKKTPEKEDEKEAKIVVSKSKKVDKKPTKSKAKAKTPKKTVAKKISKTDAEVPKKLTNKKKTTKKESAAKAKDLPAETIQQNETIVSEATETESKNT